MALLLVLIYFWFVFVGKKNLQSGTEQFQSLKMMFQGIKRGIIEVADLLLVTKCDGDFVSDAKRVVGDFE